LKIDHNPFAKGFRENSDQTYVFFIIFQSFDILFFLLELIMSHMHMLLNMELVFMKQRMNTNNLIKRNGII